MELYTFKALMKRLPARWKQQYHSEKQGWAVTKLALMDNHRYTAEEVYNELCKLDLETATADDVQKIIGNKSWISMTCNECEQEKLPVIELGEPPNYESNTAYICFDCLNKVVELARTDGAWTSSTL